MKLKEKIKQIVSLVLLSAVLFMQLPSFAQAQFGGVTFESPASSLSVSANAIAGSTAAAAATLGIISTSIGLPGVASALSASLNNVCSTVSAGQDISAAADTFSNLSLIGGSTAESAMITKNIASLVALQTCLTARLTVLKNTPITNLLMGQELQRRQDETNAQLNSVSQRIEDLRARLSMSVKDVLKAIAIQLVLNFSQKLTTNLVNKLVLKYKINNYLRYADAIATQVYDIDYIKKNYPDKENQLILASILKNDGVQNGVMPFVRMKAESALGFIPDQLTFSDPDYYVKLAKVGTGAADPYFIQTVFNDRASQVRSQSTTQAQSEISQGKGFIAPRNCRDVTQQQANIDQQNIKLSYQVDLDMRTLESLKNAGANAEEIAKGQQALATSQAALKRLPQSVPQAIVTPCEAINNPGAFVGDTITDYLNQHLQQASNIKSENMPFWGQFLTGVANNLISNVIEGGQSNLSILTGAGITAANIVANDVVRNIDEGNQLKKNSDNVLNEQNRTFNGGVLFRFANSDSNGSPQGAYNLNWDVDTGEEQFKNAKGVIISGSVPLTGVQMNVAVAQLKGIGRANFTLPGTYSFTIRVLGGDAQGRPNPANVLMTATTTMKIIVQAAASAVTPPAGPLVLSPPAAAPVNNYCGGTATSYTYKNGAECMAQVNDAAYCTAMCGGVLGAFASKPSQSIRGPAVTFSPRGQ